MPTRSLGFRMMLLLVLLLALSGGGLSAYLLTSMRELALRDATRNAQAVGAQVERDLREAMLEAHTVETLGIRLDVMTSDPRIAGIFIARHDGKVRLARPGQLEGLSTHRIPEHGKSARYDESSATLRLGFPVHRSDGCATNTCHAGTSPGAQLGLIGVDMSLQGAEEAIASTRNRVVVVSILVLVLTTLAGLFAIQIWIRRPVRELMQATRRMAGGQLDHLVPVRGNDELAALAGSFNEMQDRLAEAQRQLVVSEKLASVGRLAAGVAHEVNNPLTGVLTFAEGIRDEAGQDSGIRADSEVIITETLRIREIVKQLLEFSRPRPPQFCNANLNTAVDRTMDLIKKHPDFHDVRLRVDCDQDLPEIRCDLVQIQQVLLNLMINAVQAMPDGGELGVRTRPHAKPEPSVELVVNDTGPGIPRDQRDHIFEPFFSTKGERATGLGLAVSTNIIEQHGGHIEVESEEGRGTTFRLIFPAQSKAVKTGNSEDQP